MSTFFLKNRVKQILRMCGHAAVITVHDRLNTMDQQISGIIEQNTSLARTQTALLQSSTHVVEALQRVQTDLSHQAAEVRQAIDSLREVETAAAETQKALLESCVQLLGAMREDQSVARAQAATAQRQLGEALEMLVKGELNAQSELIRACSDQLSRLELNSLSAVQQSSEIQRHAGEDFEQQLVRQVCVETDDYAFNNPEIGLMAFLYSHLSTRKALDIGAHVGDVSEHLLQSGYEVYAFEPYPPSYRALVKRLGESRDFHHFNLALGQVEAEAIMHLATDRSQNGLYKDATVFNSLTLHSMPDDLPFSETVLVPVKPLAALQPDIIPEDVSLVKIDTEGYDLEVVRGMGEHRYPVVSVEFWDAGIPFGKSGLLYTAESMVNEMRQRGYPWHIVLYRIWGRNHIAYYCNHGRSVPESWGNIFFFREYETFAHAQTWCAAVLPRTYFKPVHGK